MRISVSWLRSLLAPVLPSIAALDTEAIATQLTALGLEVEGIERFGRGLEPVVVAQVVSIRPHPSRSGLRLVTVDRGTTTAGESAHQEVVCGAPNVPDPGGLVVLAPVGTHLPAAAGGAGMTLTPRDIGGVRSEGMLCSEDELGIAFGQKKVGGGSNASNASSASEEAANDHGIIVLPPGLATPGTPFHLAVASVLDDVFEVGVTPNRPDALGHVGVARDLAAALGATFTPAPAPRPADLLQVDATSLAAVTIAPDAADRCPHYAAAVVEGVRIAPSSPFVRYRLHALGVRSISNIVDVTNWVMLERGQPLHAFDLDRLTNKAIHVRLARAGEAIRTLDGVDRALTTDDLVICDGAPDGGVATALAGVMGGGDSEISATTTRVLIEVAHFEARGVRRTARRFGLHTEASHRFERGVDPSAVRAVLEVATAAVVAAAGGRAARGAIDVEARALVPATVTLRHARIGALLGLEIDAADALGILRRLGFVASDWNDGATRVTVPQHRPDVSREVDLIEEVARVRGLDAIPSMLPKIGRQPPRTAGVVERRARQIARDLGLCETITSAFSNAPELAILGAPAAVVRVKNPIGEERNVLRTSLLTGALAGLRRSRRHGERRARIFEVGARFLAPAGAGSDADEGLPDEVSSLAIVLAGPRDAWLGEGEEVDVFDAIGVATALCDRLTGRTTSVRALTGDARPSHLHPRGAAEIVVDRDGDPTRVGVLGPLHPDVVDALELDGGAIVVEIDLRALEALGVAQPKFRALATLPAATRDLALEVEEPTTAGVLRALLANAAGELCARVEVFDVYRGKGVAEGRKSLALRLVYRDPNGARTLTDAEIDAAQLRAIEASKSVGAVLRGG